MLYIFDLGNVTVDIDLNRILGAWSDLTRIPLATLKQHFIMGEAFHQHERDEISGEDFVVTMCHEMNMPLSYEQSAHGWQAVLIALCPEVIIIMHKLRAQGHRVVALPNTNRLYTTFRPNECPEARTVTDRIYLPQEMGSCELEAEIYPRVLEEEGFSAADTVFFDDNVGNIAGANRLGITSILVTGKKIIPDYLVSRLY